MHLVFGHQFLQTLEMRNLMVQEFSSFYIRGISHQHNKITVDFISILLYICNLLPLLFSLCVLFNDNILQSPINMRRFLYCKENERLQRDYFGVGQLTNYI